MIEELDDIAEDLADKLGIYSESRSHWTHEFKERIRNCAEYRTAPAATPPVRQAGARLSEEQVRKLAEELADNAIPGNDDETTAANAVKFERIIRDALLAAPSPAQPTLEFNLAQAKALLEMFGGDDTLVSVTKHEDVLKAWPTEYPDEGSVILAAEHREAPASAEGEKS